MEIKDLIAEVETIVRSIIDNPDYDPPANFHVDCCGSEFTENETYEVYRFYDENEEKLMYHVTWNKLGSILNTYHTDYDVDHVIYLN